MILQERLTHEGSIPTSETPKISFSCGLDKKSSKLKGLLDFFFYANTEAIDFFLLERLDILLER